MDDFAESCADANKVRRLFERRLECEPILDDDAAITGEMLICMHISIPAGKMLIVT